MRLILATAAALAALPAAAQEDDEASPLEFGFGEATLLLYGQVSQAVLSFDDGVETTTYGPVDNDNASTRIGAEFEYGGFEAVTLGARFELEIQPYASDDVNVLNRGEVDSEIEDDDLRRLEVFAETGFGTLWLGQGDMASDDSAEVDLSGTTVAAGSDVEDTAGGQLFRLADGSLSEAAVDDAFDNLDGLSRLVRVRYDTPGFLGDRLVLSASYGQEPQASDDTPQYDVAATFEDEGDALTVGAALGIAREGNEAGVVSGSASVLHAPTGLSLTVAAGREDDGEGVGGYGYAKLGYEREFLDLGATAFSVDLFRGADLPGEGSEARSVGVTAVQSIDRLGAELFATLRTHDYDDEAGDYEDATALLVGALVEF